MLLIHTEWSTGDIFDFDNQAYIITEILITIENNRPVMKTYILKNLNNRADVVFAEEEALNESDNLFRS